MINEVGNMQWTRRGFMKAAAGMAGMLGLGGAVAGTKLAGRAFFDDWRALPGMTMTLHLDVDHPESTEVTMVARFDGTERVLDRIAGAPDVVFRVPFVEVSGESYDLCAIVEDRHGRRCESEVLEVLTDSYRFGM